MSSSSSSSSSSSLFWMSDRVALVTGASSGIGKAIALALYQNGAHVGICARNEESLSKTAKEIAELCPNSPGKIFFQSTNVVKRVEVKQFVESALKYFNCESVDVMVNCAGVMYFTEMKNLHEDEWEITVDVNCKGTMNGVGAVLDGMVKKGSGHIVNISSDASKRVFPSLAVYCASKTFIDVMSEGLRRELNGSGVRVTCIQPGDVKDTNLVMNNTDSKAASGLGIELGAPVGQGWATEYNVLEPKDIADAVIYAVTAPKHVAVNEVLVEPRDQT